MFVQEDVVAALGNTALAGALTTEFPLEDLHPFAAMAIRITPGPPCGPIDVMYLFTDGSYPEEGAEQAPAWAMVVVSRTGDSYHFHGVLADIVRRTFPEIPDVDANVCELAAIAWAIAWLIAARPAARAIIQSDSLLAIGAAAATSRTKYHGMQALCADLLLVARQHMTIDLHHVKAHAGHPWNELADSVAKIASNDLMPHAPREAAELLGRQRLRMGMAKACTALGALVIPRQAIDTPRVRRRQPSTISAPHRRDDREHQRALRA
jgi:ribonuclease HI